MFQEVLVVDYISDYSKLTSNQIQEISKDLVGVNFLSNCPNGTITGVKVGKDSDLQKRVYFPFFSHISFPIKPGERAWIFEPGNSRVSYWMSRKVQNSSAEDLNFTNDDNARLYLALGNETDAREKTSSIIFDANSSGISLQRVRDNAISKSEFVGEAVFPVSKTSLDLLLQGSNGSAIILRNLGEQGTGTVDLVAGVATSESGKKILNSRNETSLKPPIRDDAPDLGNLSPEDESRITISRSFNADEYYSINIGPDLGSAPAVAIKSEKIRILGKSDIKISSETDSGNSGIVIDGLSVIMTRSRGENATSVIVESSFEFQSKLAAALDEIYAAFQALGVSLPSTFALSLLLKQKAFSSTVSKSD